MTFIIDAHLPKSIAIIIENLGEEAIHTSEMPQGNSSSDTYLIDQATNLGATIVSKDIDFYHSFLLYRKPPKLVMVKVGNMRLKDLKALFTQRMEKIIELLGQHDLLEIHADKIIAID